MSGVTSISISQSTVNTTVNNINLYGNRVLSRTGTSQQAAMNELAPLVASAHVNIGTQAAFSGVPLSDANRHPPTGISVASWRSYVAKANWGSGVLERGRADQAAARQASTATTTSSSKQAPSDADIAAIPSSSSSRRTTSGSTTTRTMQTPTTREETAPRATRPPSEMGIFEAWGEATRVLFGLPTDLLPTEVFRDGRVPIIDRLQTVAEIMNPTGIPLYRRPWFVPAAIAVVGFASYKIYEAYQTQQKASGTTKTAGPPAGAVPVTGTKTKPPTAVAAAGA